MRKELASPMTKWMVPSGRNCSSYLYITLVYRLIMCDNIQKDCLYVGRITWEPGSDIPAVLKYENYAFLTLI